MTASAFAGGGAATPSAPMPPTSPFRLPWRRHSARATWRAASRSGVDGSCAGSAVPIEFPAQALHAFWNSDEYQSCALRLQGSDGDVWLFPGRDEAPPTYDYRCPKFAKGRRPWKDALTSHDRSRTRAQFRQGTGALSKPHQVCGWLRVPARIEGGCKSCYKANSYAS